MKLHNEVLRRTLERLPTVHVYGNVAHFGLFLQLLTSDCCLSLVFCSIIYMQHHKQQSVYYTHGMRKYWFVRLLLAINSYSYLSCLRPEKKQASLVILDPNCMHGCYALHKQHQTYHDSATRYFRQLAILLPMQAQKNLIIKVLKLYQL